MGHLGSLHAKMYSEMPSVQLVGVVDVDRNRAEQIAHEYKTTAFPVVGDLLKNVDAVSVVTPTSTHGVIGEEAIQAGVHVFIEKPITSSTAEANRLLELSKKKGVKIQVGHIERFNSALLALAKYRLNPIFVESHRLAQFL